MENFGNENVAQVVGKKRRRKRISKQEGEKGGNGGLNEARGGQWGGIAY